MHNNPYLQAKAPKCAGYRLISLVSIHFPAKFSLHYSDPPLAEYKRGPSNRHLGLYTRALISRYAYDLQTSVRYTRAGLTLRGLGGPYANTKWGALLTHFLSLPLTFLCLSLSRPSIPLEVLK